jgi:NOL1/NOP2/fmu family ribosome biogenesis protein
MRVGRRHRDHYFLSQQSVVLWGTAMTAPRLELTWEEVRTFFQGRAVSRTGALSPPGEVLCTFGPWVVCRGQVEADGQTLTGMVPHAHHRADLSLLAELR